MGQKQKISGSGGWDFIYRELMEFPKNIITARLINRSDCFLEVKITVIKRKQIQDFMTDHSIQVDHLMWCC